MPPGRDGEYFPPLENISAGECFWLIREILIRQILIGEILIRQILMRDVFMREVLMREILKTIQIYLQIGKTYKLGRTVIVTR